MTTQQRLEQRPGRIVLSPHLHRRQRPERVPAESAPPHHLPTVATFLLHSHTHPPFPKHPKQLGQEQQTLGNRSVFAESDPSASQTIKVDAFARLALRRRQRTQIKPAVPPQSKPLPFDELQVHHLFLHTFTRINAVEHYRFSTWLLHLEHSFQQSLLRHTLSKIKPRSFQDVR